MNCNETEAKLISYTDGRATDAERAAVERHIETCAVCRARVAEFRGVWGVLDEAPALEPSPWFDARLRQRIAAELPAPGGWFGWLAPSPRLALATAALALLTTWIAMKPADPPAVGGTPVAGNIVQPREEELLDYDMLADFDALSTLASVNGREKPAPAKDQM
jgi:anti-sigma factor RsiW